MVEATQSELMEAAYLIDEVARRHGKELLDQKRLGYCNGMDFYSKSGLALALANSIHKFHRQFGFYPNLIEPKTFNEKNLWSKFFGYKKIPESGNKLMTNWFLPESVRSTVFVPEVVWRSSTSKIPLGDIDPGIYYLKANHGSGMVRRVQFPMDVEQAVELGRLGSDFLRTNYGKFDGEWWYNTFRKKIFLEKSVSRSEDSVAWLFYVFSGRVRLINAYQKVSGVDRSSWIDEKFNLLDVQNPQRERVDTDEVSREILSRMSDAASLIGGSMPFVRVDFLIGDDGKVYISELTHCPSNGLSNWPEDMNHWLGREWDLGI